MKRIALLLFFAVACFGQNPFGIASRIQSGTALPAKCSPSNGSIFFKTTAGPAGTPYYCSATNTWSIWTGGGSGTFNALTGDATSTSTGGPTTVVGINGAALSSLATGFLTNTTSTGVPTITVPGAGVKTWIVTPTGANLASALTTSLPNTKGGTGGDSSGSTGIAHIAAGTWSYSAVVNADIAASTIDLTAKVTGILPTANGGTANGFFTVSGPATSAKTFAFPNASATVLTTNAAVTAGQGGTGVANTATLTLGTSNQNWGTLGTGIVKNTTTTGGLTDAASADIYGLFTSCTGSSGLFLKDGGICASPGGSGTVTVVGAGSLTSTALVTGGGTTTLQTPSATATMDSSGNINTPGSVTAASISSGSSPPALAWFTGASGIEGYNSGTCTGTVPASAMFIVDCSGVPEVLLSTGSVSLVIGPLTSTNNDGACMSGTTGGIIADCGFVPVTNARNVSTSSPLGGGGALSANLTLTCATCVVASSPGAGIAHFAGSTQTATSSAVVSADLNITTTTCTSQFVSAISATAVGTCSGLTSAEIPAINLPTPGATCTFTANSTFCVATTTATITVPAPAAGYQFCVANDDNVATVITLSAIGSSARYENTARTAYGTAGTGTFVSGGAVGDAVCILGRDSTHYLTVSHVGTWTAN